MNNGMNKYNNEWAKTFKNDVKIGETVHQRNCSFLDKQWQINKFSMENTMRKGK